MHKKTFSDQARRRQKYGQLFDRSTKAPRLFVELLDDIGRRFNASDQVESLVDQYLRLDLSLLDASPHGRNLPDRHVRLVESGDG